MKALILVAHGSRRLESNQEVVVLADRLGDQMNDRYPIIETGFLELAEPSIPEAISTAVTRGATDLYVLPYFLSAGRHVHEDIPEEVAKSRRQHPDIALTVLPHIGGSSQMTRLIDDMVSAHTHTQSPAPFTTRETFPRTSSHV